MWRIAEPRTGRLGKIAFPCSSSLRAVRPIGPSSRVRSVSDLPVAVGFGISTHEQVADVWRFADAAVVGSAIVAEIEKHAASPGLVARVGEFARTLIAG